MSEPAERVKRMLKLSIQKNATDNDECTALALGISHSMFCGETVYISEHRHQDRDHWVAETTEDPL